jgi:NTP pyrophosphatase (non-canonical NTP hydrolase)
MLTKLVLEYVAEERIRQDVKFGLQRHSMGKWLQILVEEVGEVAQAMQQGEVQSKDTDADDLFAELIQVAAVAIEIAEQVLEQGVKS